MKIKEVVLAAAKLLDIDKEVEEYLAGENNAGKKKAEGLISCFNLVENALALDYLPLTAQERLAVTDKKVAYAQFSKHLSRILSVTDEQGNRLPFQLFPTEILLAAEGSSVVVEYAYLPQEKGAEEESDYQSRLSVGLMAYGVAAEYCATQGLYAEAAFWDKKYKESLAKIYQVKGGGRIRSRRWV